MDHVIDLISKIPSLVEERRVVMLIIDGLGINSLSLPAKYFKKSVYKTVFPSSTPTFFYSFHSLLSPEEHGYLDWYMWLKESEEPITIPSWRTASGRELEYGREISKKNVFPFRSLSEILWKKGKYARYYTPYANSIFTKLTSKKADLRRITYLSEIFPLGDEDFTLIYWPSVDYILHKTFNHTSLNIELKMLREYIISLRKEMPKNSNLFILSDHGLIKTTRRYMLPLIEGVYPVGGGRVAFYKRVNREVVRKILKRKKIPADVYSLKDIYGSQRKISRRCYKNFGNVVVIAKHNIGFKYPFEKKLTPPIGSHGGMSRDEININVWVSEK